MKQHQITPPPELVQQLCDKAFLRGVDGISRGEIEVLLIQEAFQAGADQELEACCEWFVRDWTDIETADMLLAARRPKPPSLKEQALAELAATERCYPADYSTIRKALEALPND